ncbi:alpha/beta hydrolase [Rhodovibrio sodomensis]|uniref:Alpha/beta hydrolase n=1 Tax=Rhodovibrio sodomensis TaxID=1088 RepID=A0ABS1DE82_9PROT|nr:alpha/beta hydrolase [Rhodovibrio sodomensis]MBK1668745.1 alpha/beta hydrolase [Rhodovibrio sodomensis]
MITQTRPRLDRMLGLSQHGFHTLALAEWGTADKHDVAICVHGLTRNGRDFDALGEAMSQTHRVLCPDVVGRGGSDWLASEDAYGYPQYMADMAAVIARGHAAAVDWVGTSMGGLIGMMLAAQPRTPIRRLVINDVGPFVPKAALQRLADYVGADPHFADFDGGLAYIKRIHAPFGNLSAAQWHHLASHSLRPDDREGGYRLAYDPKIGAAFREPGRIEDVDLWKLWDTIQCPVLVLRGADSDLLLPETAEQMTKRGPGAELVEIPDCGHAPALLDPEQVAVVTDWLARTADQRL